jgi:hypothetical protein
MGPKKSSVTWQRLANDMARVAFSAKDTNAAEEAIPETAPSYEFWENKAKTNSIAFIPQANCTG